MKLATKILLLVTVPAAMLLAVEGYLFRAQTLHVLSAQIDRRLVRDLADVEEAIAHRNNVINRDAEVISRHPAIHRALSLQESLGINQIMNELAAVYPYYNYLLIVDTEGYVFAVNTRDNGGRKIDTEQLLGSQVRESALYVKPSSEKAVIGDPAPDPFLPMIGLKPGISQWFVTPILERGEKVLGWIVSSYDWQKETLDLLAASAAHLREAGYNTAGVYLADENRRIVLATEKQGGNGDRVVKEKLLKFGGAVMKLGISYDRAEIEKPINVLRGYVFASILLFSFLTAALLYGLLHKTLLHRLKLLGAGAEELGRGNLEYCFPDMGSDEVGSLGLTFNGMRLSLASAMGELTEKEEKLRELNEELEIKVAERTKELEETHEELVRKIRIIHEIEKRQAKEQLEYQASHDALTNLPNRYLLVDRVQQALRHAGRHRRQVAVLFIDLDNFKFINDSLGHDVGDRLLKIVAHRLTDCVRSDDTVARQGGDEFVVVLSDLAESDDAAKVAQKIQVAVGHPLKIDEHELEISCSIGISIWPKDGEDMQTLLKNSDLAMFRAKEQGRNNFQFFTSELNEKAVARMIMEKELRQALERGEFLLHYQPQVDLTTGIITGMEALIRWQNPGLGMVPPGSFIPLAEDTGLIVPIGEWVMREACSRNKEWQDAGFPPLVMAVNLSPRQFRDMHLPETVGRILEETGLEPRYLELEVTESLVIYDVEMAAVILDALKNLGVQLAMDDFGTGYSSLSCLHRFPFNKLKIDLSFVREITTDPGSAAISRSIIAMAHVLNLRVIAEGVETEGQLEYLRSHSCDAMQGFYFSRPLPVQEMEQLLRQQPLRFPAKGPASPERTLLVVDDEENVLAAMTRVLREEGYRVLSADNAVQGLELLAVNRVGVVICDQRMPGMDGIEFLGRVKELYPDTVRIALTAYADKNAVTAAVNVGAIYKFLEKPWNDEDLREKVREASRHYETTRG